jgi:hypothetical protein
VVAYQNTHHTFRDLRPTLGQADQSIPDRDDHGRHLDAVFKASPRGFSFGISPSRRAR